jgi:hypothetical protein
MQEQMQTLEVMLPHAEECWGHKKLEGGGRDFRGSRVLITLDFGFLVSRTVKNPVV